MDLRVQKIQQMMRDNLHRELSLGEFARSVNLSVWRLCHVFRSEAGISPIQYLRQLRMERARHLLETSFLSVKEIAHQVGLNDESHFVRDFKKAYGEPPTRYRMRSRGEPNSGNSKKPGVKKGIDEADNGNEPPRSTNKELAKAVKLSILLFLNFLSYWTSTLEMGV